MTPAPKPITSIGLEIFREEFRQKQIERHFWVGEKERAAAKGLLNLQNHQIFPTKSLLSQYFINESTK